MYKLVAKSDHCHGDVTDTLSLPFAQRQKGRFKASTETGLDVGIFLTRGEVLREGDYLKSECGKHFLVQAEAETLTLAKTDDWLAFSKACYHLGNRHVPLQVGELWLTFQPDHVLEEMVELLGLKVESIQSGFNPENGAYASSHKHHTHSHSHGHAH